MPSYYSPRGVCSSGPQAPPRSAAELSTKKNGDISTAGLETMTEENASFQSSPPREREETLYERDWGSRCRSPESWRSSVSRAAAAHPSLWDEGNSIIALKARCRQIGNDLQTTIHESRKSLFSVSAISSCTDAGNFTNRCTVRIVVVSFC